MNIFIYDVMCNSSDIGMRDGEVEMFYYCKFFVFFEGLIVC